MEARRMGFIQANFKKTDCIEAVCTECNYHSESDTFYSEISDKPIEAKWHLCRDCFAKLN